MIDVRQRVLSAHEPGTIRNKAMPVREDFHAHVYFDDLTRETVELVQAGLRETFQNRIRVSTLREKPIGPHPLPMFEVVFPDEEYDAVRHWLVQNRQNHTVLMHPVMENDLVAHQKYAEWLGPELDLDYSVLR